MAEKIRYTRKDLKGPDEFISTFGRTVAWAKENRFRVAAVSLAVVALLAATLGVRGYLLWKESRSTRDLWPYLNRANELLQAPSEADPEKLAALEQQILAQVRLYPNTRSAVYARYYLGTIAFLRGDADSAAAQFRAGIETGKAAGVMEYLLRDGIGRSLEEKGDFAGAASAYREAAGYAQSEMRTQPLLGEARCLALAGRKDEAAALYRQILKENPESKVRNLIEIQLAQLG